jgi:hypothetical protein
MRINRGMKRHPYSVVRAGALKSMFSPVAAKKRGRPAKVRSPRLGPVARRHLATLARKRRLAEKRTFSPLMGKNIFKMLKM